MKSRPQLLLICCEGKTEAEYFKILKKTLRVSQAIRIQIIPYNGKQHCSLIDSAANRRNQVFQEADSVVFQSENEIETWIVCDRDNYKDSYTKLERYGKNKGVKVAFSDPQFENYLLQHFDSPNAYNKKGTALERKLTNAMTKKGFSEKYAKGNLDWLRSMIDQNFSVAENAIRNADIFSKHTKKPFFTVQKLAKRLLDLSSH